MKYDVEYRSEIYVTARGIEAGSRDEAIELADAQWRGKYPVVTEPSETAPWLSPDDIHVSKDWDAYYVTGDNPDCDAEQQRADMHYIFTNAGLIEGTQYVDVLDADGNPMQYGLPLDEAVRDYGEHKIISMKAQTES